LESRFKRAARDFFILSLLISPVAYFVGTFLGGLLAQFLWSWDPGGEMSDAVTWCVVGGGLLAICALNRVLFKRLSARLVEQAVQLAAAGEGAASHG